MSLQKSVDNHVDGSYENFEAILFDEEKGDNFPDRALSGAALYFAWKTRQYRLSGLYKQNRLLEMIDIIGMVFSAMMIAFGLQEEFQIKIDWIYNAMLFFITLTFLSVSVWGFLKVYKKINNIEDVLGFGKPQSNH